MSRLKLVFPGEGSVYGGSAVLQVGKAPAPAVGRCMICGAHGHQTWRDADFGGGRLCNRCGLAAVEAEIHLRAAGLRPMREEERRAHA